MVRGSRSQDHRSKPTHPLEKVIEEVSEDSVEKDLGVREDAWAHDVRRSVDAKLARMRHQLAQRTERRVSWVSAEIRALDRAALLDQLAAWQQRRPALRIAHMGLSELTTEDLRLLLAEIESTADTRERSK